MLTISCVLFVLLLQLFTTQDHGAHPSRTHIAQHAESATGLVLVLLQNLSLPTALSGPCSSCVLLCT